MRLRMTVQQQQRRAAPPDAAMDAHAVALDVEGGKGEEGGSHGNDCALRPGDHQATISQFILSKMA
jgi:hypothetical protein